MTDPDEFSGRSALITGGTRGIGKGIADRLRAGGARVLAAARSVPSDAPDDVIAADVSTADGVAALATEALSRVGRLDIVVHNVGGSGQYDGGAASLTDEDWHTALERQPAGGCSAGPRGDSGHGRARCRRDHPHHIHSATRAASDVDPLRGGQGRTGELQQGAGE